ncbi:cupin domain-containing protein [Stappia sp. ES.058]|uniref:cupin domain-containing protein n=1 Tax=Stappia sp. ES.058 TaxID=1881061 RepID=UPI00087AB097|nr:cupin domain-containing protein [Stappia sp. ES.058]SDU48626.1 hypothetical protein SAMN05428979_4289 [Stappia sp. ES.058]
MLTGKGQSPLLPSTARTATGLTHARLDALELSQAPIDPDWILEGAPQARVAQIAEGTDAGATMAMWDCTAGRFNWYFGCDEAVFILEGSVTVTGPDGETRDLSAGDTAYFPAYTWFEWHVPTYVRKVAFCHRVVPSLARVPLKVLNKLSTIADKLYTVAFGARNAPIRRKAS